MPCRRIAALAAVLALSACATAGLFPQVIGADRIAEGDALAAGDFSDARVVEVAAGLRNIEGRLAVCGTARPDGRSDFLHVKAALGAGYVVADGVTLVQNLDYFRRAPQEGPMAGQPAACADAGRDWQPSDAGAAVTIRLPRVVVERDCDVPYGGCTIWRFRQIPWPDRV